MKFVYTPFGSDTWDKRGMTEDVDLYFHLGTCVNIYIKFGVIPADIKWKINVLGQGTTDYILAAQKSDSYTTLEPGLQNLMIALRILMERVYLPPMPDSTVMHVYRDHIKDALLKY